MSESFRLKRNPPDSSCGPDSGDPFGVGDARCDSPDRIAGIECGPVTNCSEDPSVKKQRGGTVCLRSILDTETGYGSLSYKEVVVLAGHEMHRKSSGLQRHWTKVQNNSKTTSQFRWRTIPNQTPQWGGTQPLDLEAVFEL
ncbi:hypothetical protein NLI96_g9427 [Meripilus lineatus]|uniref:Uncharacterized protein n=1 Tax=Meripilus lineatus TaxID=2056292 RepID=A0AAD5V024_9APHY|nr:hypothetical protein NLI96_g9427 [Physisporinus lineatus]